MPLVFDVIKKLSSEKLKEKKEEHVKIALSEQERKRVEHYIQQMEEYILKYAEMGRQSFSYDCSKLSAHVFNALVNRFREENKDFFILVQSHIQELTVDWTGKHEV